MNYYEHHLGDYAEATAHLSFMEDAAYSRCIRKYYSSESPLPADIKAVQRLVGARDKAERIAVEIVLHEFFELRADGWHNSRCDEEIEKARTRIEAARANGRKGGRPPGGNNPTGSLNRTQQEPNPSVQLTQTKALHTPDSRHQTPEEKHIRASLGARASTEQGGEGKANEGQITPEAALAIPLREAGVKVTSMHPLLVAWVKDGYTREQALSAVAVARSNLGEGSPIAAKYLDTIIRNPPQPGMSRAPVQQNKLKTHDEREREELQKLTARREVIGLQGFRDPKPGESVSEYRNAQDEEWNRRKRAPMPSLAELQSRGSA